MLHSGGLPDGAGQTTIGGTRWGAVRGQPIRSLDPLASTARHWRTAVVTARWESVRLGGLSGAGAGSWVSTLGVG